MKTVWGMLGMTIVAIGIVALFSAIAFIGVSIVAMAVLPLLSIYASYGFGGAMVYSAVVSIFGTLVLVGMVQVLAEKFRNNPPTAGA